MEVRYAPPTSPPSSGAALVHAGREGTRPPVEPPRPAAQQRPGRAGAYARGERVEALVDDIDRQAFTYESRTSAQAPERGSTSPTAAKSPVSAISRCTRSETEFSTSP